MLRRPGADEELGSRAAIRSPETRLYTDGVTRSSAGSPLAVPPGSGCAFVPGTGFLTDAGDRPDDAAVPAPAEVDAARRELAGVPGRSGRWWPMAERALLDLRSLTYADGAVVAAVSPYWAYVWPRDSAMVVAALLSCGQPGPARRLLDVVAACQETDGTWQARYLPDASGRVPDGRGTQLDGNGWYLWALWCCHRLAPDPAWEERQMTPAEHAVEACRRAVAAGRDGLPRPSQDFWERPDSEASLGVVAPMVAGLRAASELAAAHGRDTLAADASSSARALGRALAHRFGDRGYRRTPSAPGRDASVAFLLPPFATPDDAVRGDVDTAFAEVVAATRVGNGGVRPGEDWPDHETAWTPQTSLYALTHAATGNHAAAGSALDWLSAHRTPLGSLPEKVTAAGRPAAVAPLGLTAATVLLALAHLDGRPLPIPTGITT